MHPIFFLWSHPRSVSSAFERVMHERGDLHTLHEPFLYHYYLGQGRRRLPLFEPDPDHPRDYAAIRDSILAVAASVPCSSRTCATTSSSSWPSTAGSCAGSPAPS